MTTQFNIWPGKTGTITAVFEDASGTEHPLGAVPTINDPSGTLTFTPVNTTGSAPTPQDPSFEWTYAAPATISAAIGTNLPITIQGQNVDGTPVPPPTLNATVTAAPAPEDTQVVVTAT